MRYTGSAVHSRSAWSRSSVCGGCTMEKNMQLSKDLTDLLLCLNAAQCDFLVVGAHALAAHGHPRFTSDLDLFYRRAVDNVERILTALREFGFASPEFT